jgi:hypothetical protein
MNLEDLSREVSALKARMRLMTMSLFGAIAIAVMAGGGADAVARTVVAPGWQVSTRNLAGSQTLERLKVSSDEDIALVEVKDSHFKIAPLAAAPASPADGTLWLDTNSDLKYRAAGTWLNRLNTSETVYTGAEFQTTSGTYIDVPGATLTFNKPTAGTALCVVQGAWRMNGGLAGGHPSVIIAINVDGVDYTMGRGEDHTGHDALWGSNPFSYILPIPAMSTGSHTVKLRIKRINGTIYSVGITNSADSPTRVMIIH